VFQIFQVFAIEPSGVSTIFHIKKVLSEKQIDLNMVHQAVKKKQLKARGHFYPYLLFWGILISSGQRQVARKLLGKLFRHIRRKYKTNPLFFLKAFFEKLRPKVGLYAKKIAGVTHKIPVPVSYRKSISTLLHWWVLLAKRTSRGRPIIGSLISELDLAYKSTSSGLAKKRDDVHRLAHLNRPFLRYLKF